MIPTVELRFLSKKVKVSTEDGSPQYKTIRLLQQRWVCKDIEEMQTRALKDQAVTEWRDVPLVNESA